MVNIYEPEDYAPVFDSPFFRVTNSTDDFFEVDILDENDDLLGTKRLGGAYTYNVNVANYAKKGIEVAPLTDNAMGFAQPENRLASVAIESDSASSDQVIITGARVEIEQDVLLTDLPLKRRIALGERDELPFLVGAGTLKATIVMKDSNGIRTELEAISTIIAAAKLMSFTLDMDEIEEMIEQQTETSIGDYVGFELEITRSDNVLACLEYEVVEADEKRVRLCWWNDYGAIDYYSFSEAGDCEISASREVVSTENGYRNECSAVEYTRELYSKPLTKAEAWSVAKVIYAPSVWLCSGTQVDYVTINSNSIKQSNGELPVVSIEIQETISSQD